MCPCSHPDTALHASKVQVLAAVGPNLCDSRTVVASLVAPSSTGFSLGQEYREWVAFFPLQSGTFSTRDQAQVSCTGRQAGLLPEPLRRLALECKTGVKTQPRLMLPTSRGAGSLKQEAGQNCGDSLSQPSAVTPDPDRP